MSSNMAIMFNKQFLVLASFFFIRGTHHFVGQTIPYLGTTIERAIAVKIRRFDLLV